MIRKLYKTEATIWTDYDPDGIEIDQLAKTAMDGDAICSKVLVTQVASDSDDIDDGVVSFFNLED